MEVAWSEHLLSVLFPWVLATVTMVLLLRNNAENRNPLEWSRVDRCLLMITLFSFVGGASNLVMGTAVTLYFERLAWVNWDFAHTYYEINRILGTPWIFLLVLGLWLRRRSSESRPFTHVIIQYNAVHVSIICYVFGPASQPGPFLLGMALGTLNFLLFELNLALPWLVTFTVLTVGASVATWAGLIPYAPFYAGSAFSGGKIETYYFVGTMILVMMVFLARHIPLRYTLFEGKHVGKKTTKGVITRLSRKGAEITLREPIGLLNNLKMNLLEVDQELASKDFYGKIIKEPKEGLYSHVVRFTSLPAEVRSYFQAHQQYATDTASAENLKSE